MIPTLLFRLASKGFIAFYCLYKNNGFSRRKGGKNVMRRKSNENMSKIPANAVSPSLDTMNESNIPMVTAKRIKKGGPSGPPNRFYSTSIM